MSSPDWRSPGEYRGLQSLDAPGFAWEYLRRNPDFAHDRQKLERAAREGDLNADEADAFARRWGCKFTMTLGGAEPSPVRWTAEALPSVITLTRLPEKFADPDFQLPSHVVQSVVSAGPGEYLIERHGMVLRVNITEANAKPPGLILPSDRLFDIRAAAALRLWRGLTGRNPGPNPAALSRARSDRLILALRALDGRLEGASHREIADALFNLGSITGRDWKNHDLRDRTVRLVRFGRDMIQGGYQRLLLHPFRRRS